MKRAFIRYLLIASLLAAGGCGFGSLPSHLSQALLDQPDPETARQALPAYLVMLDTLIGSSPDDVELLRSGARLYTAYAALFVAEPERARLLTGRARDYGYRALCLTDKRACVLDRASYNDFVAGLGLIGPDGLPALYDFTLSWLAWLKANSDDWGAVADLPKLQASLEHIVALDESFQQGGAHLYLGILDSLRPPSLGGRPEHARLHFERAIVLSEGRNLSAKVDFAEYYARLVHDRDLHDRLLHEVLSAEVTGHGSTLQNSLAQQRARALLSSAEEYF